MSKRGGTTYKRVEKDFYPTPKEAVQKLVPHLPMRPFTYWEPCAGNGDLIGHLDSLSQGLSLQPCDINPQRPGIATANAIERRAPKEAEFIITNPPFTRSIMHAMIYHFASQRPTWLLIEADWKYTEQANPYLKLCHRIVPIGRMKIYPDSPHQGFDNHAWFLFADTKNKPMYPEFVKDYGDEDITLETPL